MGQNLVNTLLNGLGDKKDGYNVVYMNGPDMDCNIKTVHELIKEQIRKTPKGIALVCNDDEISYEELGKRATQLAYELRSKGVSQESIVALMVDRSINMVVGMLGILMSGGAYLPIDPNCPKERICYMLDDSNAHIVLTQKKHEEMFASDIQILDIDNKDIYIGDISDLENINKDSDLAYIIYTSGSTGKPKGVMIEHKAVLNFIKGMKEKISFTPDKTILSITTISFDIVLLETLLPLSCGLKVVIADKNQNRNPRLINGLIKTHSIDILQTTPSTLQLLVYDGDQAECFSSLKELIVGGEVFPLALLNKLKQSYKGKIYNVYGPTEATVWATLSDLTDVDSVNIGKPIANTYIYIVDNNNINQTNGEQGELCISGLGLARGYINKPDLTKERFVVNPFVENEVMYKTGDIARYLNNGDIEYIGRADNQLKLRGYRIELNEIQVSILECKNVRQAVVIAKEGRDGNKYLCAYIVPDTNFVLYELKDRLNSSLPEYMIPSNYVCLEEIPLTINRKVDYDKLSKLNECDMCTEESIPQSYEEDTSAISIEQKMKQLLTCVVNYNIPIEQISSDEALTTIGIDSINFIKYIVSLEKEFGIEFNDEDLDMNRFVTFKNLILYVKSKL
ncbi:amino acid adenylation domain-containing protein [Lutispora saccharofermentans]|uniref:Amino acid adenylation domain-containing protein n=1 Tax=Lutispora saccharofermentans TaxID=3024236 RepID=A0ABT1NLH4_9FIRM|nr:non-ribosomal peptide synthetase [Lutispora saccharofermentans]MCQ1531141.1 amino acid adenylation domain-containing protein [Lutispora saccharofermentans]